MDNYKGFRDPLYGGVRYFCSCGSSFERHYPATECEPEDDAEVLSFWTAHFECPDECPDEC